MIKLVYSCIKQQILTKFLKVTIFTDEMEEIKVLELFSGIGGMHRAAQLAASYLPGIKLKVVLSSQLSSEGFLSQVVAAVDINTVSNEVYRHNHPATPCLQRNITGLSLPQLEKMSPELVLMSPPCQPHTRQGKQLDRQVRVSDPPGRPCQVPV